MKLSRFLRANGPALQKWVSSVYSLVCVSVQYLIPVCTVRYGMYEEEGEVGGGGGEVLVESWKKP